MSKNIMKYVFFFKCTPYYTSDNFKCSVDERYIILFVLIRYTKIVIILYSIVIFGISGKMIFCTKLISTTLLDILHNVFRYCTKGRGVFAINYF